MLDQIKQRRFQGLKLDSGRKSLMSAKSGITSFRSFESAGMQSAGDLKLKDLRVKQEDKKNQEEILKEEEEKEILLSVTEEEPKLSSILQSNTSSSQENMPVTIMSSSSPNKDEDEV